MFILTIASQRTLVLGLTHIPVKLWVFSQSHPDGVTLDIRTMTEPTEGIAVYLFVGNMSAHDKENEGETDTTI